MNVREVVHARHDPCRIGRKTRLIERGVVVSSGIVRKVKVRDIEVAGVGFQGEVFVPFGL